MQNYDELFTGHHDNRRSYEEYTLNGLRHRIDGPAYNSYYRDGSINQEQYYLNGELHRIDGPAYKNYHKNGAPRYVEYYINGKPHRTDGPAYAQLNSKGIVTHSSFYLDGRELSEDRYYQAIQEALALPPALRLTDPRWWVRELK